MTLRHGSGDVGDQADPAAKARLNEFFEKRGPKVTRG